MKPIVELLLFVAVALLSATAEARELHWDSLDVEATLDSEGRLRVIERQAMVFSGDWNGGERVFNVRFGQELDFSGMYRIDAAGNRVQMVPGSTDRVNGYDFTERHTLRWRSRLPSSRQFDNTPITYELHYALDYILVPLGNDTYELDHDFAFPDRVGPILGFSLKLLIDPVWKPGQDGPLLFRHGRLEPGRGYVVRLRLEYAGSGEPARVRTAQPAGIRLGAVVAIALGLLAILVVFLLGERRKGRFVQARERVDESWLDQHLFFAPPEVIGALWDRSTGAPEVAAILAKLNQQGKIGTRVIPGGWFRRPEMEMTLNASRGELVEHERELVDALFFQGHTTSTKAVRKHYQSTGLNLTEKIRAPLERLIERRQEWRDQKPRRLWPALLVPMLGSHALLPFAVRRGGYDLAGVLAVAGAGLLAALFGAVLAARARHALVGVGRSLFICSLPSLVQAGLATGFIALERLALAALSIVCCSALVISTYAFVLSFARTCDSPSRRVVRQRLILARDYFARELASGAPRLRDDWMPYLIAFGLGPRVDAWVKRFGAARTSPSASFVSSSTSSSTGSYDFCGGGGAFGGAGATGSWAAAAGSIAGGVSAPSSSSGGGGGGGSSGGGGGGGW